MYKICSKCKEEKLFSEFGKDKAQKDGYKFHCRICRKNYSRINRTEISKYGKGWRESNKNKILEYHKDYRVLNKHKVNALTAKRRATKLQATPQWLTKEEFIEIEELYQIAQAFKLYTGQEYHVDHIVPLQGENVCGLHVPWNLQILEASENLSKHNKLLQD